MNMLFLYALSILIVGMAQKERKLQIAGGIGIILALAQFIGIMILYGLSDM